MTNKLFDMLSASGAEDQIRKFISGQLSSKFETTEVDNMGNLIFHKSGNGKKLCLECGMDSRGIMVVSTESDKAYFSAVGQITPAYLAGKKIVMANGNIGIVRFDGENIDSAKLSDLYLEIETENIGIGDFGTIYPDFTASHNKVSANGLSDIIGAMAVTDAVLSADINADLTVLFSAQKQLNGRGLRGYFGVHNFDKVITVCGCECGSGVKSGCGCAVIVKDKTAVASTLFKDEFLKLAAYNSVAVQPLVSSENYFLGNISHSGTGNACIALGIPVSHKGKTLESVNNGDFEAASKLIKLIIQAEVK